MAASTANRRAPTCKPLSSRRPAPLSKQIEDRLTRCDRARKTIPAQARFGQHIEGMVDGGAEILDAHRAVLDVGADVVGFAVNGTAADAAPRHNGRPARRPMLAARIDVGLIDPRRAAEL